MLNIAKKEKIAVSVLWCSCKDSKNLDIATTLAV